MKSSLKILVFYEHSSEQMVSVELVRQVSDCFAGVFELNVTAILRSLPPNLFGQIR